MAERAGVFQRAADPHDRGNVRRSDLWRQQRFRRLAACWIPRNPTVLHGSGNAKPRQVHQPPNRRPKSADARLRLAMATEKTDVVIVGVGAAGGILAAELGKAGMKVIGLERGPRLTTQDFNPHDELRYFQRQDLRPNIKRQPITWRPNANARATPMPVQNYGNQA